MIRTDLIEIEIRGKFLMMSCDIEFTLFNIMVYISPDPYEQIRSFKSMMMADKIQNTIADLKKYRRKYYKEYKKDLGQLDEFRRVRNDMSHNRIDWDETDLTKFKVLFVDEHDGIELIHYRGYTLQYISDCMERFRKLNLSLVGLFQKLHEEVNNNLL